MIRKSIVVAAFVGLGLFNNGASALANSYAHVDQLAYRLQQQTAVMHREVDAHFRNTSSYQHLHNDVVAMEKLARHIHDVAHRHGSIQHLRADVEKLNRLFHHIEELVGGLTVTRRVGYAASSHFGQAMRNISNTLHHLRDDLTQMDYHCEFSAGATCSLLHGYRWSHYCYFPQHRCYGYYCPQASCWYYYYSPYRCFLPVNYMQRYVPTNSNVTANRNVPLPSGARPLPSGARAPAIGPPPQTQETRTPQPQTNTGTQPDVSRYAPRIPAQNGRDDRTYQYDGGPANPVPLPK